MLGARRASVGVALCAITVALGLATGATPAGAVVTTIDGQGYGITPLPGSEEAGLVERYEAQLAMGPSSDAGVRPYDVPPFGGTQLINLGGGPVMHSATTHVIYWDPNGEFTTTTKEQVRLGMNEMLKTQ